MSARRPSPLHRLLPSALLALIGCLIATATLAVGVVPGRSHRAVPAPLNRQPPRPASTAQPAPAHAAAAPRTAQRIVVLGDSVASGAGCDCPAFGAVLAADVNGAGRPATLANESRNGLTSSMLADLLDTPSVARSLTSATLVTVTIGANDFDETLADQASCEPLEGASCFRGPLAQLPAHVASVLSKIRRAVPAGAVVLVTGYWNVFLDGEVGQRRGRTYVSTSDALTRTVNALIAREAERAGARYVDLYRPFKAGSSDHLTSLLAPDGDHPSARGHRVIAAALLSTVPLT